MYENVVFQFLLELNFQFKTNISALLLMNLHTLYRFTFKNLKIKYVAYAFDVYDDCKLDGLYSLQVMNTF